MFCFIFLLIFIFDFVVKVNGNFSVNVDDYLLQDEKEIEYDLDRYQYMDMETNVPQKSTKDVAQQIDKNMNINIRKNISKGVYDMDKEMDDNIPKTNATQVSEPTTITMKTPRPDKEDPNFLPYDEIASLTVDQIFSIISDEKLFNKIIKRQTIFMYGEPRPDKYAYVGNVIWAYFRSIIGKQPIVTLPAPKDRYAGKNVSTLPPIQDYLDDSHKTPNYDVNLTLQEIHQGIQSPIFLTTTNLPEKPNDQKYGTDKTEFSTTFKPETNKTQDKSTTKNSPEIQHDQEKTALKPDVQETQNQTTNLPDIPKDQRDSTEATDFSTTIKSETQKDITEKTDFSTTLKPDTQETENQTTATNQTEILNDQKDSTEATDFSTTLKFETQETQLTQPDNLIIGVTTQSPPSKEHPIGKDVKIKKVNFGHRRGIRDFNDKTFEKSHRKKNNDNGGFDKDADRKHNKRGRVNAILTKLNDKERNKVIIKELFENFIAMESMKKYETKIVRTTAKSRHTFNKIHEKSRIFGRKPSFGGIQTKINEKSYNFNRKTDNFNIYNKGDKMADSGDGISKYKLRSIQNTKIKNNKESRKKNIRLGMDIETDRDYGLTSESESAPKTNQNKMDRHTKHKIRNHLKHKHAKLYKSLKKRHERNKKRRIYMKNEVFIKNKEQKRFNVVRKHKRNRPFHDKTRANDNERPPHENKRHSNDEIRHNGKRRSPGTNKQLLGAKRRPPGTNRRPPGANQQNSMYLTPRYEYNSRRFNENLDLTRRSNAKPISTELSYSNEENDIKFHIQDAIRHPIDIKSKIQQNSLIFDRVQNVRRQMAPVDRLSLKEESNYSDDELTIKNNIYKVFNKKN